MFLALCRYKFQDKDFFSKVVAVFRVNEHQIRGYADIFEHDYLGQKFGDSLVVVVVTEVSLYQLEGTVATFIETLIKTHTPKSYKVINPPTEEEQKLIDDKKQAKKVTYDISSVDFASFITSIQTGS